MLAGDCPDPDPPRMLAREGEDSDDRSPGSGGTCRRSGEVAERVVYAVVKQT
jgi:hypothetical protein